MKTIKNLNFGFADAANYQKRENKMLFNNIFVKGDYLDELCQPNISFLIGEKGTGKTAYAVYLSNNNYKNISATNKFIRETDYKKFIALKREKHLTISDFVSIWKVIICLLLTENIKEKEENIISKILQYPAFKALNDSINEYYYGAFSPEIIHAMTFVENSKMAAELLSKHANLRGEESLQLTFTESKFQINLMYIEKKFQQALSKLKLKNDHILFIDGIDIRPPDVPFLEYQECIKGLANAVWELNTHIFPNIKDSKRLKVVLLIRPDIFDSLGLQNQNTKLQDNSVFLDWRTTYPQYRNSKIFNIFDHLLKIQQENNKLEDGQAWDYYFPWNTKNINSTYDKNIKTSFISFLRQSYYRPRDILQMLNFLQKNSSLDSDIFSEKDFESTTFQRDYSNYLLGEIKDHLLFYYNQNDYKQFLKFFEFLNGKNRFTYKEYCKAFDKLKEYLASTSEETPKFMNTANEFLQFLFTLNVVCSIERTENGSSPHIHWCFKDRTYANISPKIKAEVEYQIFYGLAKSLNVGTALKK